MLSQGKILNVNGGSLIYPGLTESEFLSSPLGLKAEESIINGDHHSFDVGSVVVGNESFALRIFFKCGQLWMLNLYLVSGSESESESESGSESGSWSDWSEEKELQKKAKHDEFLKNELGKPPYAFYWGKVVSTFDRKGGSSSIVISYG